MVRTNFQSSSIDTKRFALQVLNIKVRLNSSEIKIEGILPSVPTFVTTPSPPS